MHAAGICRADLYVSATLNSILDTAVKYRSINKLNFSFIIKSQKNIRIHENFGGRGAKSKAHYSGNTSLFSAADI